jgi:hypothetical protein
VLVVVEHRDVQPFLQPPLDLEAPRRQDVLQVDPAVRRRDPHARFQRGRYALARGRMSSTITVCVSSSIST